MKNYLNLLNNEIRSKKELPKFQELYQDSSIVVFNKSANISVIPERYESGDVSLKELAEPIYGKLFTVHRIDKETSGVVVFAKNSEAHRNLNLQFEHRVCEKIYHAILEGVMPNDETKVDIPIATDPANPVVMRPSARGKEAITIFNVIERFNGYTYVSANLITGRQHQIRVHAKAIGLPMLTDSIYGNKSELFLSNLKRGYRTQKYEEETPLLSRVSLHAYKLTIQNPTTDLKHSFIADIPKDLKAVLYQLKKLKRVD